MSLQGALNVALSGLRVTNASVNLAARNIANAQTPGYSRKVQLPQAQISNGVATGVRMGEIQRQVDLFLQRQLRTEIGIGAQIDVRAQFLARIDLMFGKPGEANALDTILNDFDNALQDLATSPEEFGTRDVAVNRAVALADHLNRMSDDVQQLRQEAEAGIAAAVGEANVALQEVARLNQEIQARFDDRDGVADLEDQRDGFVDRLAHLMDVRVSGGDRGAVRIFTAGGNLLLDTEAVVLQFDEKSSIDAHALYSLDETDRGVGTLKLTAGGGTELDLFRHGAVNSGTIAALKELRDVTLVQAQAQLDELAHGLALAMSQVEVSGIAATVGPQTGFDIDVADLISGNEIEITVTQGGTPQTFTIVRVDDPATLPLTNDVTANPNDTVIGIDFSGGLASAAAALDTALDAALGVDIAVSSPVANTLQVLNDVAATVTIDAVTARVTPSGVQDNGLQLAVFSDINGTNLPYSGSLDGGAQKIGFAGRIAVNPSLVSDNSLLVLHSTTPATGSGDPARPLELLARFSETPFTFSPSAGIGSVGSPLSTSITDFSQRIINFQGQQVENSLRSQEAQGIVVEALNDRFQSDVAVDIDEELAQLTQLENIYAANARVMTVIQELIDILVRI